jgi:hypothetical protein
VICFRLFCLHNNHAYYNTELHGVALFSETCNRENHVPSIDRNVGHPKWRFFCFSYIIQYLFFFSKSVNSRVWGLRFSQRCCWRLRLCCLVSVFRRFERVRVPSSSGLCSTSIIVSQNTSMPGTLEPCRQRHYDISKRRETTSDTVSHLRRFWLWIF